MRSTTPKSKTPTVDKIIQCYDNGGRTVDRYTVIFLNEKYKDGNYNSLSMNHEPTSPQGFCQYGQAKIGRHLGEKISFERLPEKCKAILKIDLPTKIIKGLK